MEIETDRLMGYLSYEDDPSNTRRLSLGIRDCLGPFLLRDIFSIRTLRCKFGGVSIFCNKIR